MVTYIINANTIKEMAQDLIRVKRVDKSYSMSAKNPFDLILEDGLQFVNIGNLEGLKKRGFNLLGFGINQNNETFVKFDVFFA